MEEKLKHQSAEAKYLSDRRLANEQKYAAQALLNTQGWSMMREFIEGQVAQMITDVIDTPLHEAPEVTVERQEYLKGMIKAFKVVLEMPEQMIATAQNALDALPPEDEEDGQDTDDAEFDDE